jgi:hypothetical protein
MTGTVLLYDPTAVRQGDGLQILRTLDRLRGKVVGFIDNAKPNFDNLVDDLADLLISRYGAGGVVKRKKRAASVAAPEAMYQELAEQCDLVITGSGD